MLKNKLIYFTLLTISVAFWFLYEDYLSFLLFIVVIVLPFVLAGVMLWTRRSFHASLKMPHAVANRGEMMDLCFTVENRSIFPVACAKLAVTYQNQFYKEKSRETFLFSLQGKQKGEIRKKLRSEHCGSILVRIEYVKVYDLLKLFGLKKKIKQEETVAVLPPISPLETSISADTAAMMDSETYSKEESGDDPSEVFDIREYREGDRLQRIHWNLSLKQDDYIVKEFSLPNNQCILLLVELYRGGDIDTVLEVLVSVSYFLILQQINHCIGWYDPETEEYHKVNILVPEDLFSAVRRIFEMVPYEKNISAFRMYGVLYSEERYSHICCISAGIPDLEEKVWEGLLLSADTLTLISAVYGEPPEQVQKANKLLDTFGIRVLHIGKGNIRECLKPLVF